jgi:DnaJ-class molecular chaperone
MAELNKLVSCPLCCGVGRQAKNRECDACGGTGSIPTELPSASQKFLYPMQTKAAGGRMITSPS